MQELRHRRPHSLKNQSSIRIDLRYLVWLIIFITKVAIVSYNRWISCVDTSINSNSFSNCINVTNSSVTKWCRNWITIIVMLIKFNFVTQHDLQSTCIYSLSNCQIVTLLTFQSTTILSAKRCCIAFDNYTTKNVNNRFKNIEKQNVLFEFSYQTYFIQSFLL